MEPNQEQQDSSLKNLTKSSDSTVRSASTNPAIEIIKHSMDSIQILINSDVDSQEFGNSIEQLKESEIEQVQLLELTDGLKDQGKIKSAIRILREVPVQQSVSVAVKLGEYCLLDGQPELAVDLYENAVQRSPSIEETFWYQKNIGESYFYSKQGEKAQEHFNQALELCDHDFEKFYSLLKYFVSTGSLGHFVDCVNLSYKDTSHASSKRANNSAIELPVATKSILIVDSCVPRYDQDAGSVLMQGFLRSLVANGYSVWFYSGQADCEQKYVLRLLEIGVRYLDGCYFPDADELIRFVEPEIDVFMLTRVEPGGHYFEAVRRQCVEKPIIFNTVDLHYIRTERHYETEGHMNMLLEAKRLKRREAYLIRNADATIVISDAEQKLLDSQGIYGNIWQIPIIVDFPEQIEEFSGRSNIAFIGSYNHLPNIDAVDYFCQQVWPEIHHQFPEEKLIIVGPNAPSRWKEQYHGINNVLVAGFVQSIEQFLSQIKCTVVPLRIGAGQKGKIATSLAHGVPCLSTSVGVEGMSLTDGTDVLVCNTVQEWKSHIEKILHDEEFWNGLSENGHTHAYKNYSEITVGGELVDKTDNLLMNNSLLKNIAA